MEVEVPGPRVLCIDNVVGMASLPLGNSESPDCPLRLLWQHLRGKGMGTSLVHVMRYASPGSPCSLHRYHGGGRYWIPYYSLTRVKCRLPVWPLIMQVVVQPQYFYVISGWRRIVIVQKFSVLPDCPFLGYKSRCLLGRLLTSSAPSLEYMRLNTTKQNRDHTTVSWGP